MPKTPRAIQPSRRLAVLTLDPGFSAFGWGVVIRESGVEFVAEMNVIRTKKASKKLRILANEDNFMRMRYIAERLIAVIEDYKIDAMTFEAFSIPMKASKSNLVKIGMPYTIISTLSVVYDLAVVMSTPQHIKKAICGRINASKEEVEIEVLNQYGKLPAVRAFMESVPETLHNHGWDALAAYIASDASDVMKALKKRA